MDEGEVLSLGLGERRGHRSTNDGNHDQNLRRAAEATLVALACSKPPEGRAHWTLELLAGELIRLTNHDSISRETIRRRLKDNELKPWQRKMWCIPAVDAEFVVRMEDVLDLYAER